MIMLIVRNSELKQSWKTPTFGAGGPSKAGFAFAKFGSDAAAMDAVLRADGNAAAAVEAPCETFAADLNRSVLGYKLKKGHETD